MWSSGFLIVWKLRLYDPSVEYEKRPTYVIVDVEALEKESVAAAAHQYGGHSKKILKIPEFPSFEQAQAWSSLNDVTPHVKLIRGSL